MNNLFHVIKDPVQGTMQFTSMEDNWVKPFIDSPHFQRLRHIKQLGMSDFIFPGAVHTRFNHCLGCCYIASQIAQKINLTDEERQLVMIACLLHDIGHGPFSHTFEDIFYQKKIRHEDWTPYFLKEYSHETFFARYYQLNPRYPLTQEKFHDVLNMIMHKPISKRLLADIVSSQLDADRLDYLLRDNHFCGVSYGEYDLGWMLNCMSIVNGESGPRLGITHKGIGVVEHYLMARRLMTRNIYHSQKKLALEFLVIKLLMMLAESLAEYTPHASIKQSRLGQFLLNVNQFNQGAEALTDSTQLKHEFLEKNYANYKTLCDYDVFALLDQLASEEDTHPAHALARRVKERQMPKIIRLDKMDMEWVSDELAEFKHRYRKAWEDWQIQFIQTPHQSYSGEDPILVVNEEGTIRPISDFSFMINAISDKFEHSAFLAIDKLIIDDERIQQFIKTLRTRSKIIYA